MSTSATLTSPPLDARSQFMLAWLKHAASLRSRTPNDKFVAQGKLHQADGTGDNIADRPEVLSILDNGALGLFDVLQRYPNTNSDGCQYEIACHLQGVARKLMGVGFVKERAFAITGSLIRASVLAYDDTTQHQCHIFSDALEKDTSVPPNGFRR